MASITFRGGNGTCPPRLGASLDITEHSHFQMEASKLGRTVLLDTTVYEKRDRRRTGLHAEAQCSDPHHFIVQFVVRDAESVDDVVRMLIAQLEHRGFEPTRYRMRSDGGWDEWVVVAA